MNKFGLKGSFIGLLKSVSEIVSKESNFFTEGHLKDLVAETTESKTTLWSEWASFLKLYI